MGMNDRDLAASRYEQCADELEAAARHLRVAAGHFRGGEIPRGCAHAFAAHGHAVNGNRLLEENAVLHASKSVSS